MAPSTSECTDYETDYKLSLTITSSKTCSHAESLVNNTRSGAAADRV